MNSTFSVYQSRKWDFFNEENNNYNSLGMRPPFVRALRAATVAYCSMTEPGWAELGSMQMQVASGNRLRRLRFLSHACNLRISSLFFALICETTGNWAVQMASQSHLVFQMFRLRSDAQDDRHSRRDGIASSNELAAIFVCGSTRRAPAARRCALRDCVWVLPQPCPSRCSVWLTALRCRRLQSDLLSHSTQPPPQLPKAAAGLHCLQCKPRCCCSNADLPVCVCVCLCVCFGRSAWFCALPTAARRRCWRSHNFSHSTTALLFWRQKQPEGKKSSSYYLFFPSKKTYMEA